MHHLKETIITILPGLGGLYASLQTTDVLIKITVGLLTMGWLILRILLAWQELKSKKNS